MYGYSLMIVMGGSWWLVERVCKEQNTGKGVVTVAFQSHYDNKHTSPTRT
jgi:hypothetical protein